jgi:outer membrane autotransporter protein
MNKIYQLVWDQIAQTWVAVSELVAHRGKTKGRQLAGLLLTAAMAASMPMAQAYTSVVDGSTVDITADDSVVGVVGGGVIVGVSSGTANFTGAALNFIGFFDAGNTASPGLPKNAGFRGIGANAHFTADLGSDISLTVENSSTNPVYGISLESQATADFQKLYVGVNGGKAIYLTQGASMTVNGPLSVISTPRIATDAAIELQASSLTVKDDATITTRGSNAISLIQGASIVFEKKLTITQIVDTVNNTGLTLAAITSPLTNGDTQYTFNELIIDKQTLGGHGIELASSGNTLTINGNFDISSAAGGIFVAAPAGNPPSLFNITATSTGVINSNDATMATADIAGGILQVDGQLTLNTLSGGAAATLDLREGGQLTGAGALIVNASPTSIGVNVTTGASTNFTGDLTVATQGSAAGIVVTSDAADTQATTLDLSAAKSVTVTAGGNAIEINNANNASASLANATMTANDRGVLVNTTGTTATEVSLTNSKVTATNAAFDLAQGAANLHLSSGSQLSTANYLTDTAANAINVGATGAATLTMDSTGSQINGHMQAQAGSILNATLDSSTLQGAMLNVTTATLNNGTTWLVTANSDVGSLNNTGSTITFDTTPTTARSMAPYKTITTKDYVGGAGAIIQMNAVLGGDDPLGDQSDNLVITDGGRFSGETTFEFTPAAASAGAATYEGILFLDAQGSATVDVSQTKLKNGYVGAGAFGYVIRQGSYTDSSQSQDLFLTNFLPKDASLRDGVIEMPAGASIPANPGNKPGTGQWTDAESTAGNTHLDASGNRVCDNGLDLAQGCQASGGGGGGEQIITGDVVVHSAAKALASGAANDMLASYHKRMGNQNTATITASNTVNNPNSWGRIFGQTVDTRYAESPFGETASADTAGFQLGHTFIQRTMDNGAKSQTGAYLAYAKTDATLSVDSAKTDYGVIAGNNMDSLGDLSLKSYALGITHTMANAEGRYVDFVGQYSYYDSSSTGQTASLDSTGFGLRASVEAGFPLYNGPLMIEPQVQLILFKDSFDDATDSSGKYVMNQGDSQGVVARAGLRFASADMNARFQPSLTTNIWRQNAHGNEIEDKTNGFVIGEQDQSVTWGEVQIGASYAVNDRVKLYGHVAQTMALEDNAERDGTQLALGVNMNW